MAREIRARIVTIGRPLRVEVELDGAWLERLQAVLNDMEGGQHYPIHRYIEELIEADIVYREGHNGVRGPYLSRGEIVEWLRRRHRGEAPLRVAAGRRFKSRA